MSEYSAYDADIEAPLAEHSDNNSSNDSQSTPTSNEDFNLQEEMEEFETSPYQEKTPGSSVSSFGTIMNLLNSLLGAGILAVPNSMIACGLLPSVFLLAAIAAIAYYSTAMEMKLQLELGSAGLDDLALKIMGKGGQVVLSILTLAFCLVANLAYIIISSDTVASWFAMANIDVTTTWKRAGVVLAYSILLPVTLSIPRSMRFLSWISTAALVFVIFFEGAMVAKAIKEFPHRGIHKSVSMGKMSVDIFFALSVYGLTFTLPITTLPIVDGLPRVLKKRNTAASLSSIICFFLVIVPGIIGYLMFGDETKEIILENFNSNDTLMVLVRAAFFFVVTFSYPCMCQQIFASWGQLLYNDNNANNFPLKRRAIVQFISHIIPIPIAMFFPQIKPVLSVGGALGGCIVGFSYPALLWYMHYRPTVKELQFWLVWGLFVFGIVIAAVSITISVIGLVKK